MLFAMTTTSPRTFHQWVDQLQDTAPSALERTLAQADQLHHWNLQLRRRLPKALAESVRLCNIRKNGVAVIAIPSQTIANQVYLHQHLLLEALQKLQLPVTRISLRIHENLPLDGKNYRALPSLWATDSEK